MKFPFFYVAPFSEKQGGGWTQAASPPEDHMKYFEAIQKDRIKNNFRTKEVKWQKSS